MKEFKFGNTTVIIHSPLMDLTEDERKQWFEKEKDNNEVLKSIAKTVNRIYQQDGV